VRWESKIFLGSTQVATLCHPDDTYSTQLDPIRDYVPLQRCVVSIQMVVDSGAIQVFFRRLGSTAQGSAVAVPLLLSVTTTLSNTAPVLTTFPDGVAILGGYYPGATGLHLYRVRWYASPFPTQAAFEAEHDETCAYYQAS
jgi:hypothetical protein